MVYTFALGSTPPPTPNTVVIWGSKKGLGVGVMMGLEPDLIYGVPFRTPDRDPDRDPLYGAPSRARARA